MANSKTVGDITEAMVLAAFIKEGYVVCQPFGDNQRYDLVIEVNSIFYRVQCKTSRVVKGVVEFDTCSSQSHCGGGKQNYKGQADLFASYCPELNSIYVVPVDIAGTRSVRLRLVAPKNNQKKNIRWAKDYEFPLNPLPI